MVPQSYWTRQAKRSENQPVPDLRVGNAVLEFARHAGGQGDSNQSGDIIYLELLHHGLAVAAHRLNTEIEQYCNVFGRFSFDDEPEHLKLPRCQLRQQWMSSGSLAISTPDARQ